MDNANTGHNLPPSGVNALLDRLTETHADAIARRDELLGGIQRAPDAIEDEVTAGKFADFVQKQIDPFLKRAGTIHDSEKEPYLSSGRTVDGFWHTLIDEITKGKAVINARRKAFADAKAAEERRRREDEARAAREEQIRAQRAADEAAAKIRTDADLRNAIVIEEDARAASALAARAAESAAAKPAEMGRTRGEHGGMTVLKQFWNFSDLDRTAIDLESLRSHLPADAIEKAVRSWILANKAGLEGGAQLTGVRIFSDTRL